MADYHDDFVVLRQVMDGLSKCIPRKHGGGGTARRLMVSMIEHELRGVQQGPDEVLVGLGVRRRRGDEFLQTGPFFARGFAERQRMKRSSITVAGTIFSFT